jgi:hypothetical protein
LSLKAEFRALQSRNVVIHTLDGQSFRGLVVTAARRSVRLVDATRLEGDEQQQLKGIYGVPYGNVGGWQEV